MATLGAAAAGRDNLAFGREEGAAGTVGEDAIWAAT